MPPPVISYETSASEVVPASRPSWIYWVGAVYLLLLGVLLTLPMWSVWLFDAHEVFPQAVMIDVCLAAAGLSLMIVPVRVVRRRPIVRRTLWLPIIVSGLLAVLLVASGGFALAEWMHGQGDEAVWAILAASAVVWIGWTVVFAMIALSANPQSIGLMLHRRLIVGSVLELLIAVPAHLVVRRRSECCAGFATGLGICAGVAVMILAFGPSVFLLFYQRGKRYRTARGSG